MGSSASQRFISASIVSPSRRACSTRFSSTIVSTVMRAAAAARITVETIVEENLVEHARRLGETMLAEMKRWEAELPIVSDVRGRGLLIGMDLVVPGTRTLLDKKTTRWIFDTLLSRGVLAMIYNPEVRINPPLVIEEDQAMSALVIMKDVLGEAAERLVA